MNTVKDERTNEPEDRSEVMEIVYEIANELQTASSISEVLYYNSLLSLTISTELAADVNTLAKIVTLLNQKRPMFPETQ